MNFEFYIFLGFFLFFIQKQQRDLTYQLRDNNTAIRFEGNKSINVSAPDLELLSFTAYREEIKKNAKVNLGLMFFMTEDTLLYITARETLPGSYYLMKPKETHWHMGWNRFYPWPTDEVINPLKIDVKQIGIVGRLYKDRLGNGKIVPIILYDKEIPDTINNYTMFVRPKETLSDIELKITQNGNIVYDNHLRGTYFAQRNIPITFPFKSLPDGEYTINLRCRVKNSLYGPDRVYHFYHKSHVE